MAIALTKVPYIASTFAGPRAAQAFYARGLTKLAFGSFLAILPTIAGPVFCILLCQQRKAMATSSPLEARDPRGRSNIFRASARYLRDFDGELSIQALQVVHNMTIGEAGYLANTNYVGTGVAAILTGMYVSSPLFIYFEAYADQECAIFKCYATSRHDDPVHVVELGVGSQRHHCMPSIDLLSSGIHAVSAYIGVLDGASPSTLSMRLALAYLSSMIGASIALAISGAIWTNVFPARLASNLADMGLSPEEETRIYSSLIVQLSHGPGTPIRNAIIRSYGEVFRTIMTAATAFGMRRNEGQCPCMKGVNTFPWDTQRGGQTSGEIEVVQSSSYHKYKKCTYPVAVVPPTIRAF
ncbi:hypothetical protein ACCO45_009755 [Purpureocillium lilacinum]|uniref:Uncharacterized protein n=1 Tax=Purpureocillium lilacinum TaxID=33203 RepID=A0ACC4DMX2_PURLI